MFLKDFECVFYNSWFNVVIVYGLYVLYKFRYICFIKNNIKFVLESDIDKYLIVVLMGYFIFLIMYCIYIVFNFYLFNKLWRKGFIMYNIKYCILSIFVWLLNLISLYWCDFYVCFCIIIY